MAMDRARAEMDKKDGRDWWEKRDAVEATASQQQQTRNARPHPSQVGGYHRNVVEVGDLLTMCSFL
jgi:hypothetical protein